MDRLIAELEEKAERRIEEILAEAGEEAAAIRAAAEREVERVERMRLAECAAEWKERTARRTAEARGAAAKVTLRARARFLDRVFERAAARIDGGDLPDRYDDEVGDRVALALRYLGERPATFTCPPAREAAIRAALPEGTVELRVDDAAPVGFVARADDGSVEVDGTLIGALERGRDELAIAVLDRFEDGRG